MWISEIWRLSEDKKEIVQRLDISLELIGKNVYGSYKVETLKTQTIPIEEFKALLGSSNECAHLLPRLAFRDKALKIPKLVSDDA